MKEVLPVGGDQTEGTGVGLNWARELLLEPGLRPMLAPVWLCGLDLEPFGDPSD
jgi:hypothetical protein